MKKLVYRLQFSIKESGSKEEVRDDKIDTILSSMDIIDTDRQIYPPLKGSIIEIDNVDYKVIDHKYKFIVEADVVYHTTIVTIQNPLRFKPDIPDRKIEDFLKICKENPKYWVGNKYQKTDYLSPDWFE